MLYSYVYTYLCGAVFQLILSRPVVGSAAVLSLDTTWLLENYPGEDESTCKIHMYTHNLPTQQTYAH